MAMGIGSMGVPPTPGPVVSVGGGGGGFFGLGPSASEPNSFREEDEYDFHGDHHDGGDPTAVQSGEAIVVSVGLVASGVRRIGGDLGKTLDGARDGDELHRIYPLDHFTLDVFVFNQSEWTRRFEVTCPDRRRGRARNPGEKAPSPGIVPLDNRVRIGCVASFTFFFGSKINAVWLIGRSSQQHASRFEWSSLLLRRAYTRSRR
jgi:hypothetical protein